jgi:DmsE family decaheme c-type cytochrome
MPKVNKERMTKNRRLSTALLLLAGLLLSSQALAQEAAKSSEPVLASKYSEKGADTCIQCHDEESLFPVFSIFKTKHAQPADKRAPFANLQCESCHGPRGNHRGPVDPDVDIVKNPPIINFGKKSRYPVAKQNAMCLQCHDNNHRIGWQGGAHDTGDVACADCHKVHVAHDPVLAKATQPPVCYACHKKERTDFSKPSAHPVRVGELGCTDCHEPHGGATTALLVKPTLNQTCYTCHAEKRGPFLWEHAPVAENCAECHTPHGSSHPALLVKRPLQLCQQCHSQAGHPSIAHTATGLPTGSASGFLLAGSCTNCHSQVHGSNHPSGVKLMR